MARFGLTGQVPYPRYGYYNGSNNEAMWTTAQRGLGRFRWDGGNTYVRDNPGPTTPTIPTTVISSSGNYLLKTPRPVQVGSEVWMYGDTYEVATNNWRVDLLKASSSAGPFTRYGTVFDPTGNHIFQVVLEDPTDIPSRRFKMWYSQNVGIGYAYSANGTSWTDYGQVIDATRSFEYSSASGQPHAYICPDTVLKVDGEWFFYYACAYAGAPGTADYWWQSCLARFTNPESTYTNRARVPSLYTGQWYDKTTTIPSGASAGATSVTVADASVLSVGDPIYLFSNGVSDSLSIEFLNVLSKPGGNVINLGRNGVATPLQTAKNAGGHVRHGMCRSFIPTIVFYDPTVDKFRMLGTTFHAAQGVLPDPIEDEVQLTADNPEGPWTLIGDQSPTLPRVPSNRWDGFSAENNCFIVDSSDPVWSLIYTTPAVPTAPLTLDANAGWTQSGQTLHVAAASGARESVRATVNSTNGGTVSFAGADAAKFSASLDGTTWSSTVTVPSGSSTIYLSVLPGSTDIQLHAVVGIPT